MRQTLVYVSLTLLLLPLPAAAQQWSGSASVGVSAGHQTNAYLDPVLNSWDVSPNTSFAAVTPQVSLSRNGRRSRVDVMGRARLYPRRDDVPQFLQGTARFRYRLSPAWTIEGMGGGTRYRFLSDRDAWWALPAVRWSPTERTTLTIRGGITERYVSTVQGVDRQPSALVAVSAGNWLSDRVRIEGRGFWSSGRTSTADAQFGGTGGTLRVQYWPTNRWSIATELTGERLQYDRSDGSSTTEYIGRGGIETEWRVHSSTTVFANAKALGAQLGPENTREGDVHVSAGIRVGIQRVLGGTPSLPPQRQVCRSTDDGARVSIPFDGTGTPYVTGDFNGWSSPGIALSENGDGRWTTTLDVPPGKYAYRIRIVTDSSERWLELPSYARTTKDAFGGSNGLCTVQ